MPAPRFMVDSARAALDLLFPPRCAICGAAGYDLCPTCLGGFRLTPEPRCGRCSIPLPILPVTGASENGLCAECLKQPIAPALDRIVVAAVYEGATRDAIHALKFQRRRRAAGPLGALLAEAWAGAGLRADVIVPVPLHPERRRERGYNQAELLARVLASRVGTPMRADALARVRATRPQSQLDYRERLTNVVGAFALGSRGSSALQGKAVLLVDDVTTTGASLQAAGAALATARPTAIYALTVARPMRSW